RDVQSGCAAEDCPAGIYAFTYSPSTEGAPLFNSQTFQIFEVHKLADESIHFVGFMTDEDAHALDSASEPVELKLYPEPFDAAQKLVSVPQERIFRPRPTSREHGNWMPFSLVPK